jgi:hypothetical protein
MSRIIRLSLFAIAAVSLLLPVAASAHESRAVGKYQFVVGFLNEPAFEGEQNGVSVRITNTETGQPVEQLAETLKAQVIFGSQQRDLELEPVFRDPGHYKSDFYPTAAGAYTFKFTGEIEGTAVDESFTSSPDGFAEVVSTGDVQFPATLPSATELNNQLVAAQSAARTATILGGAGLAFGLISLIVAVLALRRRSAGAARRESSAAGV